jgi:hypothetical protein
MHLRESIMVIKLLKKAKCGQDIVAIADIRNHGKYYSGLVDLDLMPSFILSQSEEYESLVNAQVLSLLDKMEEQIDLLVK